VYGRGVLATALGVLAFAAGVGGYLLLGWRFGGSSDLLPTALALGAVLVALVVTARERVR
jgi:hypothetical protein